MTTILLVLLGLFALVFVYFLATDIMQNKEELKKEQGTFVTSGIIGFVTNFLDTLGIGSFAPTTALLRFGKQVNDRVIPGTLNVSCTLPVIAEAFLFIRGVAVEPITLVAMIGAATVGSFVGAGVVSKLPTKTIQRVMGIALLVTAGIMLLQMFKIFPAGGEAIGLTGVKLIAAIVANFILGALMTAGIGLYAPCMALVYLLGMSPVVAFPIMMGSCAFLMPVASAKFIKEGAYARKASLAISLLGLVGVFFAYVFVKSLDLYLLKWLVIGVVIYTAVTLIMAAQAQTVKGNLAVDKANL